MVVVMKSHRPRSFVTRAGLVGIAVWLICDIMINVTGGAAFTVPSLENRHLPTDIHSTKGHYLTRGYTAYSTVGMLDQAGGKSSIQVAAVTGSGIAMSIVEATFRRLVNAASAGVIAAFMHALGTGRTPALFMDQLPANLIKLPLFEVIYVVVCHYTGGAVARGLFSGLAFTVVTLPLTNKRYRASRGLPSPTFGELYEAFVPTLMRDIAYGIARSTCTLWALNRNPTWATQDPRIMFWVIAVGCLASSPFQEWRLYTLKTQSKYGEQKTREEFFNFKDGVWPRGYDRFAGAVIQGVALAMGYVYAPTVTGWIIWWLTPSCILKDW